MFVYRKPEIAANHFGMNANSTRSQKIYKFATKTYYESNLTQKYGTLDLSSAQNQNFGKVATKSAGKEIGSRAAIGKKMTFFAAVLVKCGENFT